VRMVAWWFLVTAPMFAEFFALATARMTEDGSAGASPSRPGASQVRSGPSLAAGVFVVLLAIGIIFSVPWFEHLNPLFGMMRSRHRLESDLSVIARQIETDVPGSRVFSRLEWGEYFDWSLAPPR